MIKNIATVKINFDQDLINARHQAQLIVKQLGFDRNEQTSFCTALSEISRNCLQYAGGGEAEFYIEETATKRFFKVSIRDQGPGIKNLEAVLQGQFVSTTGLGKGIIGSRRLLPEEFSIVSIPNEGTTVTLAKALPSQVSVTSNLLTQITNILNKLRADSPLEQVRSQADSALSICHDTERSILESIRDGYFRINYYGKLIDVNQAYCALSGYTREELLSLQVSDLDTQEVSLGVVGHIAEILAKGGDQYESKHKRKDNSVWDADISIHPLNDATNDCLVFVKDITDRKIQEREMRISAIAFESHEGIMITDENQIILKVNKAFSDITGYSAEEVIGKTPKILSSNKHTAAFYEDMWASIHLKGAYEGEVWNRRKNGEGFAEHLTITSVKDNTEKVINYVALFTDNTPNKAKEEEIRRLAFYDPLTRLPNRRLLIDRLKQALHSSNRSCRGGALLFIDLDNFKYLNDTYGHDAGDSLLQMVAERLKACARETDTAARLGGDEFIIMLEDLSENEIDAAAQAETIGNKILFSLNQPYNLADCNFHNSPSIGIALFNSHKLNIDELLKHADIAMYQAKKAGRNTLRFFDPKMQESINIRAKLEIELRNAIAAQQFQLYFQLQVNSQNVPLGAEVLIRWLHPVKGIVSPAEFIPLAEEIGLILPIGYWVLEKSCAQLSDWSENRHTKNLSLSVNVSPKQFHQPDFSTQVQSLVNAYKINPKLLKLELTESMLLDNIEETIVIMDELKALGVSFSLDDFGTGFSSLQYLKRLPLEQLKIDQSFVRDLQSDVNDAAIVRTIINLGKCLGLTVIAEGVEHEEQSSFLIKHGCKNFQGYFFSKPLKKIDFEEFLRNFNVIR